MTAKSLGGAQKKPLPVLTYMYDRKLRTVLTALLITYLDTYIL